MNYLTLSFCYKTGGRPNFTAKTTNFTTILKESHKQRHKCSYIRLHLIIIDVYFNCY